MIVCPVCEHPQAQGATCDVCGRQLIAPQAAPEARLEVVPGFELTRLGGAGEDVEVAALPELEQTMQGSGPDLPAQTVPEMEQTRMEAHSDTPILPLDEMETGRAEPDGVTTPAASGPLTCRYCRHVQASGAFCDACGMRLSQAAPAAATAAASTGDEIWAVCQKCGSRAMVGRRCGSCGIVMEMPKA